LESDQLTRRLQRHPRPTRINGMVSEVGAAPTTPMGTILETAAFADSLYSPGLNSIRCIIQIFRINNIHKADMKFIIK
jgi:hypothetical protein